MQKSLDEKYLELVNDILRDGKIKKDRTGVGTKSIFGTSIRHDMREGFPLLTTKKVWWKGIVYELLWFLKGDTNIKYLVDNGVHIWDEWAYENSKKIWCQNMELKGNLDYSPEQFPSLEEYIRVIRTYNCSIDNPEYMNHKWLNENKDDESLMIMLNQGFMIPMGEINHLYGFQWCRWGESRFNFKGHNQIQNAIVKLKNNPDDRGILVSAWNVEDLDNMALRPCHYSFQLYTEEMTLEERRQYFCKLHEKHISYSKNLWDEDLDERDIPKRYISLLWNQRSCDWMLGNPFNIASYGLLLSMFGQQVNMVPKKLIGNYGDSHIYLNHMDGAKEQLYRDPNKYSLPKLQLNKAKDIFSYTCEDCKLTNYQSYPTIKLDIAV